MITIEEMTELRQKELEFIYYWEEIGSNLLKELLDIGRFKRKTWYTSYTAKVFWCDERLEYRIDLLEEYGGDCDECLMRFKLSDFNPSKILEEAKEFVAKRDVGKEERIAKFKKEQRERLEKQIEEAQQRLLELDE